MGRSEVASYGQGTPQAMNGDCASTVKAMDVNDQVPAQTSTSDGEAGTPQLGEGNKTEVDPETQTFQERQKQFQQFASEQKRKRFAPAKRQSEAAAGGLAESDDKLCAYLLFSSQNHGEMTIIWSKTTVEGALAYGKPTVPVPAWKVSRGKSELVSNIQSDKKAYYRGWAMFFKQLIQVKAVMVDLGTVGENAPIPTSLWLHYSEDDRVQKVLPNTPCNMEGIDAVAVVHRDNNDLDCHHMDINLFVPKGAKAGYGVALR